MPASNPGAVVPNIASTTGCLRVPSSLSSASPTRRYPPSSTTFSTPTDGLSASSGSSIASAATTKTTCSGVMRQTRAATRPPPRRRKETASPAPRSRADRPRTLLVGARARSTVPPTCAVLSARIRRARDGCGAAGAVDSPLALRRGLCERWL